MGQILTVSESIKFNGKTYSETKAQEYAITDARSFSPTAGVSGELTTRTSDVAGVITLPAGHGYATSDDLKLFTPDGGVLTPTYTISGNAMTITGITPDLFNYNSYGAYNGSLLVLPALNEDIVVGKANVYDLTSATYGGTVVANPSGIVLGSNFSPAYFRLWYNTGPVDYILHHLYNKKAFAYLYSKDQRYPSPDKVLMPNITRLSYWCGTADAPSVDLAFLYGLVA